MLLLVFDSRRSSLSAENLCVPIHRTNLHTFDPIFVTDLEKTSINWILRVRIVNQFQLSSVRSWKRQRISVGENDSAQAAIFRIQKHISPNRGTAVLAYLMANRIGRV